MSYIPRRRLVLASTCSKGIHDDLTASQMPWDAEEAAHDEFDQDLFVSSQVACLAQEGALTAAEQTEWDLQLGQLQASLIENRETEQTNDRLAIKCSRDVPPQNWRSCQHHSSTQHAVTQGDNTDRSPLPLNEYSDVYNFLTKGTGHVHEVSVQVDNFEAGEDPFDDICCAYDQVLVKGNI